MKKIICFITTIMMLATSLSTTAFAAMGSDANIDAAVDALKKAADTTYAMNDMTAESYLAFVSNLVPKDLDVKVDLSPMGHFFRITNAREVKSGSVTANFRFSHQDVSFNEHDEYITFKIEKLPEEELNLNELTFVDVPHDSYYARAVKWAVDSGITSGTSDTTFSPDDTCTRAQVITFLWRASGAKEQTAKNPFSDVSESDYFYHAAVWASKKGMITDSKFNGNSKCTRSDAVYYIWKAASTSKPEYKKGFTDVSSKDKYASAVQWAVNQNITSGTSDTTFSPKETCTRAQIVTFLIRAFK